MQLFPKCSIEVTQVTEEMEAEELQQALLAKEVSEQKVIDLEQTSLN
jgi:hypothetical protein